MKSRISFFNPGVLKKDITRFSPVWGLYSILLLILYISLTNNVDGGGEVAYNMVDMLSISVGLNLVYSLICAFVLFGDLFKSRLCNALHAMPMRREGWFFTHLTAGFLFMAVPNGLFALLTALQMGSFGYIAVWWYVCAFAQFVFFFGAAVLAMICAGNHLGAAALYGTFNFLPILVYVIFGVLYLPQLPGVVNQFKIFSVLTPVIEMASATYLTCHHMSGYHFTITEVFPGAFGYTGICAGVGVLALILALVVYKKRPLEHAGDLLSVKSLKYLFLPVCTYGCGTMFFLWGDLLVSGLQDILLVIGLVVGFFAGQMLLDKSVRVFRAKAFLALGALVLLLFGTIALTAWDPIRITRYVPQAQQVQEVTLQSRWEGQAVLTEKSDIETVIAIHEAQIETTNNDDYHRYPFTIDYTLNNGRTVSREYQIVLSPETTESLLDIFSRWEIIFPTEDWQSLYAITEGVYVNGTQIPKEEVEPLLKAIALDCDNRTTAQFSVLHQEYDNKLWIEFRLNTKGDHIPRYANIQVYSNCENTLALIEKYDEKN